MDVSVSGTIERVTFHQPDNGFCVLRVRAPDRAELVTVEGGQHNIPLENTALFNETLLRHLSA